MACRVQGIWRGKGKITTKSCNDQQRADDLVNRDFTAHRPNQLWVADFTYVKTLSGWVYTAFIIIRTAVNKRKVFPSDQAAFKVVYLATQQASSRWSMPSQHWTSALNRFMIMFDDRISKHLI